MARFCTVCSHPQRLDIDALLLTGTTSNRAIASRYGLGRSAVNNHAARHVRQRIAAAQAGSGHDQEADILAGLHAATVAADVAACVTLRDHVLHDLARIERVIEAGLANGSTTAVMSALRVKYLLLSRAGLVAEIDKSLSARTGDIDPAKDTALRLQNALECFVSGRWAEDNNENKSTSALEANISETSAF
jgi:hypothetical protein